MRTGQRQESAQTCQVTSYSRRGVTGRGGYMNLRTGQRQESAQTLQVTSYSRRGVTGLREYMNSRTGQRQESAQPLQVTSCWRRGVTERGGHISFRTGVLVVIRRTTILGVLGNPIYSIQYRRVIRRRVEQTIRRKMTPTSKRSLTGVSVHGGLRYWPLACSWLPSSCFRNHQLISVIVSIGAMTP